MPFFQAPFGNAGVFDANGNPLTGGSWRTFLAGTSTAATTYTSQAGTTPQGTTMTLNTVGLPVNGPVWMLNAQALKFRLFDALGVFVSEWDNVSGMGDTNTAPDEWVLFAAVPTYLSPTTFTLAGDQTNIFQAKRKLKSTNSGGTVYGTIVSSVFATTTTVTVTNSVGVLDAGLSAVSYGLLAAVNSSIPTTVAASGANSDITSLTALTSINILPGYLFGCTMSTAGASATMSIAAGRATDSTGLQSMALAAIAKTTSAWAVGTAAGGLDTGAIAINSWYHYYVIRRTDTGVVDQIFSLSATAPALPTNYTQFRRIGSARTNASSQWEKFTQSGNLFLRDVSALDANGAAPTVGTSITTSVPTGIVVEGIYTATAGGSPLVMLISSLSKSDETPGVGNFTLIGGTAYIQATTVNVLTNTSAQIRVRGDVANAYTLRAQGWYDTRGREA